MENVNYKSLLRQKYKVANATYIKTNKPIRVKEINYEEFENKKMSDLGLAFDKN